MSVVLKNINSVASYGVIDSKMLSFYDWKKANPTINLYDAARLYKNYLENYSKQIPQEITASISNDYRTLVRDLLINFKDDPYFERISKINLDSKEEIYLAIPKLAKKLKEIALYYSKKRKAVKDSRAKNSLIGSQIGLTHLLKKDIQDQQSKEKIFPKKEIDIQSNLSSIEIEFVELIDQHNYWEDQNQFPTGTTNPLFFILENYINDNYDSSSIPIEDYVNPLSDCENDNTLTIELFSDSTSNSIANDILAIYGGFYYKKTIPFNIPFKEGNNYLHWFGGEYYREAPEGIYEDIQINSLDWNDATSASSIDNADVIWCHAGNVGLWGAWLSNTSYSTSQATLTADIKNHTMFKFPFPGTGTSAEGTEWSGPTLSNQTKIDRKFFPSEESFLENQENIKDLYWSEFSGISSCEPLLINNSKLIESLSPSFNYKLAPKLKLRTEVSTDLLHDFNPNQVFDGDFEECWLYDFKQTELSIKSGINNILYPITAFNPSDIIEINYESGNSQDLSAIPHTAFAGAVAGNDLTDSDILIKLQSPCGPEIERAYLKGQPLSKFINHKEDCACDGNFVNYYTGWRMTKGSTQPALSFKGNSGETVRFVWTGPKTNVNEIFKSFDHDATCEFHKEKIKPNILEKDFSRRKKGLESWNSCNCRSVYSTPLGHNGTSVNSFNLVPDLILLDTNFPTAFNTNTWIGRDGKSYKESEDVAWFKNTGNHANVNWSKGSWITSGTGQDFFLETGKTYQYYRSNLNRCEFELPYLIQNHCYISCTVTDCDNTNCVPAWKKSIQNAENNWIETDFDSDMKMESGYYYQYLHQNSSNVEYSRIKYDGTTLTGDYVSLSADDPKITFEKFNSSLPSINFNIKIDLENNLPYWADVDKTLHLRNYNNRIVNEYVVTKQPEYSLLKMNYGTVLEFDIPCDKCFNWQQPVEIKINIPTTEWKKIDFDRCVESEILDHLYNRCENVCEYGELCGCNEVCKNLKYGLTATDMPSDIVLNTELSGIPVFIEYFAQKDFNLSGDVFDITNGDSLSAENISIYSKANFPWRNLPNTELPIIANFAKNDFVSKEEKGLLHPNNISTGKWLAKNYSSQLDYSSRTASSLDIVSEIGRISSIKEDSSWNKLGTTCIRTEGEQSYVPYNSLHTGPDENYIFSESDYSKNYRGQKIINCGENAFYENLPSLTANMIDWNEDIWGNQYFVFTKEDKDKLDHLSEFVEVWIKTVDGNLSKLN